LPFEATIRFVGETGGIGGRGKLRAKIPLDGLSYRNDEEAKNLI
jgi:hypothetical protein